MDCGSTHRRARRPLEPRTPKDVRRELERLDLIHVLFRDAPALVCVVVAQPTQPSITTCDRQSSRATYLTRPSGPPGR